MDRYKCKWQNEKYNYVKANKFSIPLQESFVHESSMGDKVMYVYWVLSYECVYMCVLQCILHVGEGERCFHLTSYGKPCRG